MMTRSIARWLIASVLCGFAAPLIAQEPDMAAASRIGMDEFRRLHAAGTLLVVDVRDPASFATGHIPGARSIALGQLTEPGVVAELKAAGKPIVLYCA